MTVFFPSKILELKKKYYNFGVSQLYTPLPNLKYSEFLAKRPMQSSLMPPVLLMYLLKREKKRKRYRIMKHFLFFFISAFHIISSLLASIGHRI